MLWQALIKNNDVIYETIHKSYNFSNNENEICKLCNSPKTVAMTSERSEGHDLTFTLENAGLPGTFQKLLQHLEKGEKCESLVSTKPVTLSVKAVS